MRRWDSVEAPMAAGDRQLKQSHSKQYVRETNSCWNEACCQLSALYLPILSPLSTGS